MNTNTAIQSIKHIKPLHRCHILMDNNGQHAHSHPLTPPQTQLPLISEAMLPQIRTIATLIAAERHSFQHRSPDVFTEEADFFAARILVLGVRRFHLDITLMPMLKTANQRAQRFAQKHHLPFIPADMQMLLHTTRPAHILVIETEHSIPSQDNLITNSLAFAAQLPDLFL